MRYDTKVVFNDSKDVFNPSKGDLVAGSPSTVDKMCAVADLSTERQAEMLGRINKRTLSIHYRGPFTHATEVEIKRGIYKGDYTVVSSKNYRNKHYMLVEEMK